MTNTSDDDITTTEKNLSCAGNDTKLSANSEVEGEENTNIKIEDNVKEDKKKRKYIGVESTSSASSSSSSSTIKAELSPSSSSKRVKFEEEEEEMKISLECEEEVKSIKSDNDFDKREYKCSSDDDDDDDESDADDENINNTNNDNIKSHLNKPLNDYLNIVGSIMYPSNVPTTKTMYNSNDDLNLNNLEERPTALGYLTSPIFRPSVIQMWSPYEIAIFEASIMIHGKHFHKLQRFIKTKTTKDIIEFYYVWKKTNHYLKWKRMYYESDFNSQEEQEHKELTSGVVTVSSTRRRRSANKKEK